MKNDTNNQPGSVGWGCVFQRTAGGAELLHQLWQGGRYGGGGCPAAETVQPLTEEPAQAESSTVPGTPQTPAVEQTGSAAQTTAQSAAPIPNTSDAFPLVPVLLLLAFSACGLTIAVVLSRRRKR